MEKNDRYQKSRSLFVRIVLLIALGCFGGAILGLCSQARAGGADERIDPFNGCYADPDRSSRGLTVEADYINNRGKYLPVVDDARKEIAALCWNGVALCAQVPSVCYTNGKITYRGPVKYWRCIQQKSC